MIATTENTKKLNDWLESYQIESTEEQRELLLSHLDLVVEKNKVVNLTRILNEEDAIILHVVDSLLMLPVVQAHGFYADSRFLDMGTGAGFPGIPLAIMSGAKGMLVDSVGKKVNAVQEFLEELALSERVEARSVRVEQLALDEPRAFDLVTARAVADSGILLEYASPMLRNGGKLCVLKANIDDAERKRADKTASMVGMKFVSRETYELPLDKGHREILIYEKYKKPSIKLPRQIGMAKKKPLAE